MTTDQPPAPARAWYQRKKTWVISTGLLILFLLILISLPFGISFGLADFLKQHGARQVHIENIDFNPFTGRLLFQNVRAQADEAQDLRLDRLELEVGWRDLFSKRARVHAVNLQGLQAEVDMSDSKTLKLSGLSFPLDEGQPVPVDDSAPWGFALDSVEIRESELTYREKDLRIELFLEHLALQKLVSWNQQVVAKLNLNGQVNKAPVEIQLNAHPFSEAPVINGRLSLGAFSLADLQPLLTRNDGPNITGMLSLKQAFQLTLSTSNEIQWRTQGQLEGTELNASMPQLTSQDQSTRWDGEVAGSYSQAKGLLLDINGELSGALPALKLPDQTIDLSLARYSWQGGVNLQQGTQGMTLKAGGDLQIDDAQVIQANGDPQRISNEKLRLKGLSLEMKQDEAGQLSLTQQGHLSLAGLGVVQHELNAGLSALQWDGSFSLQTTEAAPELTAQGAGLLEGIHAEEAGDRGQLVNLKQIKLAGFNLSSDNQAVLEQAVLQGIRLTGTPGAADAMVVTEKLTLNDIRFSETTGLGIALIEQQGMQSRISLDKAGQSNFQVFAERLQRASMGGQPEEVPTDEQGKPLQIKIDRLVWAGDNQVHFSDQSVSPAYKTVLKVESLELKGVDSNRPDVASPFKLVGSTGRHSKVKVDGELTLFQTDPSGKINGRLEGVELVPLSSYTTNAIGYHLDSGELDADIGLTLTAGEMAGKNHLIIRRLEVSQVSKAQAEKLNAKISMPLDAALGMLMDKNDTIDLNLPVSGKLSDPNVELGDVINTALGNALKKGAMTYLTTALFPYGTVVALLKMAGDASAVQLDPVEFEPAMAELDDKDRDYLSKVAQVLKDRPKIAIKLCGVATALDRQALNQALATKAKASEKAEKEGAEKSEEPPNAEASSSKQSPAPVVSDEELMALAQRRAELVEDYFVKQHGISAGRAAVCRPVLNEEAGAVAKVDLQI
ncbi:MAG: DUF748 domain-containing protein [Candidatus Thiodiazotropha sp. (ex Monitilora ramsayi)]|nr:DUF748 domain-containing protein [Candidatus Thiodiazotropha sp. (ex Monitilora ramsayi)]